MNGNSLLLDHNTYGDMHLRGQLVEEGWLCKAWVVQHLRHFTPCVGFSSAPIVLARQSLKLVIRMEGDPYIVVTNNCKADVIDIPNYLHAARLDNAPCMSSIHGEAATLGQTGLRLCSRCCT